MKRFTLKFFLLAIGMILSVGAYAQDPQIEMNHRFPTVKFISGTGTYYMPAWDYLDTSNGRVRIKAKGNIVNGETVKAMIVSRFGYDLTKCNYVVAFSGTALETDGTSKKVTILNGKEENMVKDLATVTYGDVFDGIAEEDKNQIIFDVNIVNDATGNITGTYTVPSTVAYNGCTLEIDEIGPHAYRNSTITQNSTQHLKFTTLNIPGTVKSIDIEAFRNVSTVTKINIGSGVEELGPGAFNCCSGLKSLTIPETVTKINGGALGGCRALTDIHFTSAPDLEPYEWSNGGNPSTLNFYTGLPAYGSGNATTDLNPANCLIHVPLGKAKQFSDFTSLGFVLTSPMTLAKDFVTYCSDTRFTVRKYNPATAKYSDGDLISYYVKKTDVGANSAKLTKIDREVLGSSTIPVGFGVIINGEADKTYPIFYPTGTSEINVSDNCLIGVLERTQITPDVENFRYYILSDGQFYPVKDKGWLGANKAYIKVQRTPNDDETHQLTSLALSLPEETGIATLETKRVQNDTWYTLQGIQVQQPSKGVFIKNGKKFVIK